MGLSKKEKLAAVRVTAPIYQKAARKRKVLILDEFVALTGYNRAYAAWLLTKQGSETLIGKNIILKCDVRKSAGKKRSSVYNQVVLTSPIAIWYIMDCICGKRLAPIPRISFQSWRSTMRFSLMRNPEQTPEHQRGHH